MDDSIGWILLVAGLIGSLWFPWAKRFHTGELVSDDVVVTKRDPTPQGMITSKQRTVLVIFSVLLAIIGAYLIQRTHNWNPFAPNS